MRGKGGFPRLTVLHAGITPAYAGKSTVWTVRKRSKQGITPAYAGKRDSSSRSTSTRWDHPRMCGEKCLLMPLPLKGLGSPPHVRGKALFHVFCHQMLRITPACAGKSLCILHSLSRHKDHPRMCGEKRLFGLLCLFQLGSPPHVRGKVSVFRPCALSDRITPACAGKSTSLW